MHTAQIPKARLDLLINQFPRLYAEHPSIFHTFFDIGGKMIEQGYCAYDALKRKRHKRMCSPKKRTRGEHNGFKNLSDNI